MRLDRTTLDRFLQLAADRLDGDWVVVGGMVLPLVGIEHRVTLDIDVAGPEGNRQTLELLELAAELGLAPEAVNQAAAFFLHRIEGWQDHLIPVRKGLRGTFHRPDATLYVLLKLWRLTETDLADCRLYLDWARAHGEKPDAQRIRKAVRKELRARPTAERCARLQAILASLA